MKITVLDSRFPKNDGLSSPHSHRSSFVKGLRSLGISAQIAHSNLHVPNPHVVVWGWRQGKFLYDRRKQVIVMERGYIGDRFSYTSLGWNGLNGRAEFADYQYDGLKRFHSIGGKLKPWKKDGEQILILGQVPGDASLQGRDMVPWYEEMAIKVTELYGLPVYFRPHPDCARKGVRQEVKHVLKSEGTLHEEFDKSLFVIGYNSNSLLDAVMHGVPAFAGDAGSMVYDLCSHNLDEIIYPERDERMCQISYSQFSKQEMEEAWPIENLLNMKVNLDGLGGRS